MAKDKLEGVVVPEGVREIELIHEDDRRAIYGVYSPDSKILDDYKGEINIIRVKEGGIGIRLGDHYHRGVDEFFTSFIKARFVTEDPKTREIRGDYELQEGSQIWVLRGLAHLLIPEESGDILAVTSGDPFAEGVTVPHRVSVG